jgi:hypothetical protein
MSRSWVGLLLLIFILSLAGCSSPAPGCNTHIPWSYGGCFGKSAITDLSVTPSFDCLSIDTNNCNGGIIVISNLCNETVTIGKETIVPNSRHKGYGLSKEGNEYLLIPAVENWENYIPDNLDVISIHAKYSLI